MRENQENWNLYQNKEISISWFFKRYLWSLAYPNIHCKILWIFFFFKSNQNCVLSWFCWTTKQSHNILEIYFKFKEYCDWIGVSKVKSPYYLTWFPHDHACCTSSLLRPQLFLRSSFSLYFPCSTHIHQNLTLQLW